MSNHDVTANLQGRGHLLAGLGKPAGQNPVLLDRLRAGNVLVGGRDGAANELAYAPILRGLLDVHLWELVRGQPCRQQRLIERDEGRHEMPSLAHHHGVLDRRVRSHRVLEHRGLHVLARGQDEKFLLAANDGERAIDDLAEVAGGEPSVAHDLGRRLGGVPVTGEDVDAAGENLAIVGQREVATRDGFAHGAHQAGLVRRPRVRRGGLREAVALQNLDPKPAEEMPHLRRQPRATRKHVRESATKKTADLAEDKAIGHAVAEPKGRARAAGFASRRHLACDLRRPAEERLAHALHRRVGAVVDGLEHARHQGDPGGSEAFEIGRESLVGGRVTDHGA